MDRKNVAIRLFYLHITALIAYAPYQSFYPLVPTLALMKQTLFYNIYCLTFFKAITYLQSAQRLKGEDVVEADDISEIAGVRSIISQLQLQYYFYEIKGLAKLHVFNVT